MERSHLKQIHVLYAGIVFCFMNIAVPACRQPA